eukprot:CAMPEP_0178987872 /NCGR_PEP_ID=MMETSP0795-20121207/3510_1 /TAXON_ID=88552 /ORGANISM="Amoebophrya sp., Strain Ameob2" /LENGTH=426 /DNA_ID=CAMNT_0020679111 /DNA_START=34 /DNA_END=1310 /DNA_ORIENTATION=-
MQLHPSRRISDIRSAFRPFSTSRATRRSGSRFGFLPFSEARLHVREIKLRNCLEYRAWSKSASRPLTVPSRPDLVYAKCGWKGYPDFMGYEPSKFDPVRGTSEDALARQLPNATVERRTAARIEFLNMLKRELPEFEARQLSAVRPTIVLLRKTRSSNCDGTPEVDSWIATQLRFASTVSRRRDRLPSRYIFNHIIRRDDVGLIFLSDRPSKYALKRGSEVAGKATTTVSVPLREDENCTDTIREKLELWWSGSRRDSFAGWSALFGPPVRRRREDARSLLSKELYERLDFEVERIFPQDVTKHGNVLLSGMRCLEAFGLTPYKSVGFIFDINRYPRCGKVVRGKGWDGHVQKYICVVLDQCCPSREAKARGVFVFPRDYVFRKWKGGGPVRRGRFHAYPPGSPPLTATAKAKQVEDCRFYIDFET